MANVNKNPAMFKGRQALNQEIRRMPALSTA